MKTLNIAVKMILFFTFLTGIAYPFLVTGISQVFFPEKSDGSIIRKNGHAAGSQLIGQQFDSARYFTSRPSATNYNTLPSGGSNFGPASIRLKELVETRKAQFIVFNGLSKTIDIPGEMLFSSASGLDPDISPKAALLQVDRICRTRHFNTRQKIEVIERIKSCTEKPVLLFLGEERVNVLLLNLSLDSL
jgi:potassium-transporting ATPase KdpC subunit